MRKMVAYSRTYATSLLKGLKILSLFSRDRQEWGITELSLTLGAAKSTISRIARTLEAEGFLTRDARTERFRLGIRLWELGCVALDDSKGFQEKARRYLEEIVKDIQENAQASVLDGLEVVYVAKVDAPRSVRPHTVLGSRFPAHCTATGRALLAYQPDSVILRLIKRGLPHYTSRTIVDGAKLIEELERVRAQGYAINRGEWREDVGGIAAPARDRTGAVVGALGVTIPLTRFPKGVVSPMVKSVIRAAENLSRQLGYLGERNPVVEKESRGVKGKPPGK